MIVYSKKHKFRTVRKYNKNNNNQKRKIQGYYYAKSYLFFVQNDRHFLVHFLYLLKEKNKLQKAYFPCHFKYSIYKYSIIYKIKLDCHFNPIILTCNIYECLGFLTIFWLPFKIILFTDKMCKGVLCRQCISYICPFLTVHLILNFCLVRNSSSFFKKKC